MFELGVSGAGGRAARLRGRSAVAIRAGRCAPPPPRRPRASALTSGPPRPRRPRRSGPCPAPERRRRPAGAPGEEPCRERRADGGAARNLCQARLLLQLGSSSVPGRAPERAEARVALPVEEVTLAVVGMGWRRRLAVIPEIQERCGSTAEAVTRVFPVLRCSNFSQYFDSWS